MERAEVFAALGSGFGRFDPLYVFLVAFSLILLLGGFTFFEILKASLRKKEKVQTGWQYFSDLAEQKGLDAQEVEHLRGMVEDGEVGSADMVFDSAFIYEDALEAYLAQNAARFGKDETAYAVLRRLRRKLGFHQLAVEVPVVSTRQFEEGLPAQLTLEGDKAIRGKVSEVNERHWYMLLEEGESTRLLMGALRAGDSHLVSLFRPGDGEYGLMPKVASLRVSTATICFEHSRELERRQQRSWVRVEVNIPCRATVQAAGETGAEASFAVGQVLEGRLLDISGGGACARFSFPLPQGCRLLLNFDLPGTPFRGVRTEIMRLSALVRGGREVFEHNLKFLDLDTPLQERIVRYVFEKQRNDSQLRGAAGPK